MFGGIARFSQQSFLKDKWAKWAGKLKISQLFRESAKKNPYMHLNLRHLYVSTLI